MRTAIQFIWEGIAFCSVATVLALTLFGGYIWLQHGLSKDKSFKMMAVLYNIDVAKMEAEKMVAMQQAETEEDIAYETVLRERAIRTMDHHLREQAIEDGLADLRLLQRDLVEERRRYDLLKTSFDAELKKLSEVAKNDAIIELQQTLETIKPRQAKDHIVRMLPTSLTGDEFERLENEQRRAVIDVVTILKAMPLDKRKKILAEFKEEEDAQLLAGLLRLIRIGVPETTLVSDARDRLQQFNPN